MQTPRAKQVCAKPQDLRRFSRLVELYEACLANAESLHQEAQLLLQHGFAARAYALAHTGWEEVGKAQIVADFAYGLAAEAEFNSAFRDHKIKAAYNTRQFWISSKDETNWEIRYDRAISDDGFDRRQRALYVDRAQDDTPVTPATQLPIDFAQLAVGRLGKQLDSIRWHDSATERIGSNSFLK